jgi:AcrR family transcriptional regulator
VFFGEEAHVRVEFRPRRRQARGERRMAEILDAAALVFAEVGYEAATTNAIAARAGISPGSLYQFFPNKEAIAEALAERFVAQMREAYASAFDMSDVAGLSLDELLDRTIDPIVAFNVANPGFKVLFAGTDMPARLAASVQPIQEAVVGRVEAIIAAWAPTLSRVEQARYAQVSVQIVKAMVPLIVAARGRERSAVIAELKKVLRGYLAPAVPGEVTRSQSA